jgi:RNA polymerase sigma-70 factor (ECF subfamily)
MQLGIRPAHPFAPAGFLGRLTRFLLFGRSVDQEGIGGMGGARVGSAAASHRLPMEEELRNFVTTHYNRLIRLAVLVCRNVDDAEDAVQAALERAWRSQGSLRDRGRLKPWLDRIVVREAIRIGRARTSLLSRLTGRGDDDPTLDLPDPRGEVTPAWTELRAAFSQLSAEQRAVVALHLYAGYSVAETAELVGVGLETVRSRLRLARERLRRELGDER